MYAYAWPNIRLYIEEKYGYDLVMYKSYIETIYMILDDDLRLVEVLRYVWGVDT